MTTRRVDGVVVWGWVGLVDGAPVLTKENLKVFPTSFQSKPIKWGRGERERERNREREKGKKVEREREWERGSGRGRILTPSSTPLISRAAVFQFDEETEGGRRANLMHFEDEEDGGVGQTPFLIAPLSQHHVHLCRS
jgi:hypothetical protein